MRRKIFLLAAPLCLAGCHKAKEPEPSIQAVRAGVVQEIQPAPQEKYSVSIEPYQKVDLAFKSGGIVQRILQVRGADGRIRNVQAGDRVARNAELAQVRPLDYEHALEQAQAQLAQAEAQRARAEAELKAARANFTTSEIEYTRANNLFREASLVKPQYDEAKGRFEANAASVAAAEDAVRAAASGVENARALEAQQRLSLRDTALRAPFAGWVAARNVDRGSVVNGTTIGYTIVDTHLVKAVFAVPDFKLTDIRRGQKQPVLLEPLQRSAVGTVTSISPQADAQSRVFTVEVTLDNPREDIRPGMIGSLILGQTRGAKPRLVVPLAAVVRAPADPNGFAVFRLIWRGGKSYAAARAIGIGETFGDSIEVTRGLSRGDRIVTLGAALLRDGQQVSVIP
ncbi:MAG TPA: efflux RND transporter periplasmic adaptor subunit [Bryobacteraceae bacterium]|jgi:RND family efflux transporter MFP subunit|nr:efflux RND transporter periplasmic adaptor subunit [Bryobacteraceae bacterium]